MFRSVYPLDIANRIGVFSEGIPFRGCSERSRGGDELRSLDAIHLASAIAGELTACSPTTEDWLIQQAMPAFRYLHRHP